MRHVVLTIALSSGTLLACGGSPAPSPRAANDATGGDAAPASEATPTAFAEQAALGGSLYGEHCASCHGSTGQGTPEAPRVVGIAEGALSLKPRAGAKRAADFVTVADVAGFAVAAMPPDAPGGLLPEEYWAILAFDLSANGIVLEQKLTPELSATLTIPR